MFTRARVGVVAFSLAATSAVLIPMSGDAEAAGGKFRVSYNGGRLTVVGTKKPDRIVVIRKKSKIVVKINGRKVDVGKTIKPSGPQAGQAARARRRRPARSVVEKGGTWPGPPAGWPGRRRAHRRQRPDRAVRQVRQRTPIYGGAGVTTIDGGIGNDQFTGGSGTTTMIGFAGFDVMTAGAGVTMSGGTDNNRMTGGSAQTTMDGGEGVDTMIGGSGPTTMRGGGGNDAITGGIGATSMVGGGGDDTMSGGTGPRPPWRVAPAPT